jgi:hypothetical protein
MNGHEGHQDEEDDSDRTQAGRHSIQTPFRSLSLIFLVTTPEMCACEGTLHRRM